ncbi:hypothetical protein GCM10018952_52510 [Streptosporangium vulgare]
MGALTAAMATWSSRPSMSGSTSASDAAIASIAPPGGKRLHQPGPCRDQRAGVGQGEDSRHVGGGDLADGVAGHDVRPDPQGGQQAGERDLEGEEGGLGHQRLVEHAVGVGEHRLAERVRQLPVQQDADLLQRLGEHREGRGQVAAHAQPLAALPGEQQGEPAAVAAAGHHVRCRRTPGQCPKARQQFLAVGADDHRALFQ